MKILYFVSYYLYVDAFSLSKTTGFDSKMIEWELITTNEQKKSLEKHLLEEEKKEKGISNLSISIISLNKQ